MKTLMITALFSVLSVSVATANTLADKALSYVPNGTIVSQDKNEFDILTTNNTIVEIELKNNGDLDEASGDNILKDTFTPDQGLVGLDAVTTAINAHSNGAAVLREWSLDHNLVQGWHYEVEVLKGNVEYEYLLDAKTGNVISAKVD